MLLGAQEVARSAGQSCQQTQKDLETIVPANQLALWFP